MIKSNKLLFIFPAVLFSFAAMFGLSYLWHSVLSNGLYSTQLQDFPALSQSQLVSNMAICYAGLSIAMTMAWLLTFRPDTISLKYALAFGIIAGLSIHLALHFSGLSLFEDTTLAQMGLNIGWQIFEQTAGALIIGLVYNKVMKINLNQVNIAQLVLILLLP